jgi:AAA15 family ATPase/GTPase
MAKSSSPLLIHLKKGVTQMITKLSINNFKSIKELDIDCARVNLFIGEPNTGKSNMLEALGLLSWAGHRANTPLNEYVRFDGVQNLFYDNLVEEPIRIETKGDVEFRFYIKYDGNFIIEPRFLFKIPNHLLSDLEKGVLSEELKEELKNEFTKHGILPFNPSNLVRERNEFQISDSDPKLGSRLYVIGKYGDELAVFSMRDYCNMNYSGEIIVQEFKSNVPMIKFYRYNEKLNTFKDLNYLWLTPPNGSNLFSIVMGRKALRDAVSSFFKDADLRLVLKPFESIFGSQKQVNDEVYDYPYILASDTIRRMIFYNIAIDSNENSTLVFEEPEVHAFPAYIKQLGEKIAFDESNQYFIVTHNPYLFLSIVENMPKREDVNVFMTYMKDYQTKVKMANEMEVSKLMRYDPFFNLLHMIEEKE